VKTGSNPLSQPVVHLKSFYFERPACDGISLYLMSKSAASITIHKIFDKICSYALAGADN
jgi:hypothetical protein